MNNLSPSWQNMIKSVGLYLAFLALFIGLFTVLKMPWLLALMWIYAIGGLIALGFQARPLLGEEKAVTMRRDKAKMYAEQARTYKKEIDELLRKERRKSVPHLDELSDQVQRWLGAVEHLIATVEVLNTDPIIHRDRQMVPQAIADLEAHLASETRPDLQTQLQQALETRLKQQAMLEKLDVTVQRAEIQIEGTLSMLGTIYSQLLTSQSTNEVGKYMRLREEVNDEVLRLADHQAALEAVKLANG